MSPDHVESLGLRVLAHRFKRAMHLLLDQAEAAYAELGAPIKPRWCSTLSLLEREGPLAVKDVARRIGLSHPAVVQILDDMADSGLVRRVRDGQDGRRARLTLTPRGRRWMPALRRVWDAQAEALDGVLAGQGQHLLGLLERTHAELSSRGLAERMRHLLSDDDLAGLPGRKTQESRR